MYVIGPERQSKTTPLADEAAPCHVDDSILEESGKGQVEV